MTQPQLTFSDDRGRHPLFAFNPRVWLAAAPSLFVKRFADRENVVSHGDAADNLWLLYRGWVKLIRQTPDGKEAIVGLCTGGDIFGEAALFADTQYPYTAEVMGEGAELAAIPVATIRQLMSKDALVASRIIAMLGERLGEEQLKLEHRDTMSAAQRLGCFLLRLCSKQQAGNIEIPIKKNVLAAYLGMKPETLSRSQQQLAVLGIRFSNQHVSVPDVGPLRNFVCGSCSKSGSCEVEEDLC